MSDHNNIYNIMSKLDALKPEPEPETPKQAAERIYESVEAKGSILEGVKTVEQNLSEKYMGFKKTVAAIKKSGTADNPEAVAAAIGRKKYGKAAFQKAAAAGTKMDEEQVDQNNDGKNDFEDVKIARMKAALKGKNKGVAEGTDERKQNALWAQITAHEKAAKASKDLKRQHHLKMADQLRSQLKTSDNEQGVAEGMNDTVYPNAQVIKSKNGKPVGEIYQDASGWGCFHYRADRGYDGIDSREDAIAALKDLHQEIGRSRPDYTIKGVAEERETLKTKHGTIYKGGTYGTDYDGDDAPKKPKHVPKTGQKGRPKKDAAPTYSKTNDPFGRVPDTAPKGKKGTVIKGKGNQDTVDEAAKWRDPEHKGQLYTQEPRSDEDDYYGDDDYYNPKPDDYPGAKNLKGGGEFDHNDPLQKGFGRHGHDVLDRGPRKGMPSRNHITSLKGSIKAAHGKHAAPVLPESRKTVSAMVLESVNFKKMMDECDMTMAEMLECIDQDIKTYKTTGDMTDRLRDFMHLHQHAKKQMEENKPVPYEVPAVQRRAAGAAPLTPSDVQAQDAARSMHPGMTKLDAPAPAVNDELDELAKLAGITDEGNAFTGKLASTPKGGEFELDGNTFKDTSNLDESMCNECGMYESQCSCQEGNLFTKHLKDTPDGGEFEIDGKKYKDTSSLEEMARLAGIFQEGKDYGDTTYNEPPTYDNTPDEQVQDEDVLLRGGDGEVAGMEKKMSRDGAARFSDNPLAMKESQELIKPAAEFDFVEAMGRKLMQAYEGIKAK